MYSAKTTNPLFHNRTITDSKLSAFDNEFKQNKKEAALSAWK